MGAGGGGGAQRGEGRGRLVPSEVEYTDQVGAWWEALSEDDRERVAIAVAVLEEQGPGSVGLGSMDRVVRAGDPRRTKDPRSEPAKAYRAPPPDHANTSRARSRGRRIISGVIKPSQAGVISASDSGDRCCFGYRSADAAGSGGQAPAFRTAAGHRSMLPAGPSMSVQYGITSSLCFRSFGPISARRPTRKCRR